MGFNRGIVCILPCVAASVTLAHSGRTDSRGGHWDAFAREYHYHHGMSAHDHPNGICPYGGFPSVSKGGKRPTNLLQNLCPVVGFGLLALVGYGWLKSKAEEESKTPK